MADATQHMRKGELVPDATVWDIVHERTECLHCGGGFILDGFPRTVAQAESLQQLTEEEKIPLSAVVDYELDLEEIVSRLSGRRTCQQCKAVYHVSGHPPRVVGVCDACGGALLQREDDRPDAISVRMEAYEHDTRPLIEFYSRQGLLVTVRADGSAEEICDRTVAALESRS
jgi:adenylate kinase